jgi:protein-S-isoprenylcysteine O-methyltransferase Ste14
MKLKSPHGMSPTGVGPLIYLCAVPFIVTGFCFSPHISNNLITLTIGYWAIIFGCAIFIKTFLLLMKEFYKGNLVTTGAFMYSRNPLYSCWILFIIPGMALMFLNWWFLLGSFSMYIGLVVLIKKEEDMLERAFGQEYLDYKKKVGRLIWKI